MGGLKLESGEVIVEEAIEAAKYIPDARSGRTPTLQGHFAASPAKAAGVEFMNAEVARFLDIATEKGKRLE